MNKADFKYRARECQHYKNYWIYTYTHIQSGEFAFNLVGDGESRWFNQIQEAYEYLATRQQKIFCLGDHVIFRDRSKDIYGVIIGSSDVSDNHLRIAADDGSGWHIEKDNIVHAD